MSDMNTGNFNSGYRNSGHFNSGDYNSGNRNSGYRNSGHYNSGDYNSGYRNSGNCNSGNRNSGYRNSGHYNSGHYNSGHYNSGNYNSGNRNSGHFNTDEPDKIRIFNTWVDMTPSEFYEKYDIAISLPLNTWVDKDDMTDEEKKEVIGWVDSGGYLKTRSYQEAWGKWWEEHPGDHQKFLDLPHFDADIFKEITGIDVEKKCHPDTITVDGVKYRREA